MDYDNYVKIVKFFITNEKADVTELATHLNISEEQLKKSLAELPIHQKSIENLFSEPIVQVKETYLYNKDRIRSLLRISNSSHVLPISLLTKVDSTNTFLKSNEFKKFKHSLCITEMQTGGRGRRGKIWHSPFGENIYFSFRRKLNINPKTTGCLSLITGLSIVSALNQMGYDGIKVKWPNDILFEHKKLSGILIEVISTTKNTIDLVIGIGINVQMKDLSTLDIEQPWINLTEINNKTPLDRNLIIATILNELEISFNEFEVNNMQNFNTRWKKYDYLQGQEIIVKQENSQILGKASGINAYGELIVETDKKTFNINSGEVSVRLINI